MKLSELIQEIRDGKHNSMLTELYGEDDLAFEQERYISVIQKTIDLFGDQEGCVYSAPGRTEVGGNHTDHQLGRVLAASINLDTIAAVIKTDDNKVRLASRGFEIKPVDLSDLSINAAEKNTTESLIRGVAAGLKERGWEVGGFMAYSESDVIAGGGMSSSAAFEVLLGTIESGLYNDGKVSAEDIAKVGQYAENIYFMKASGLMDQMASSVGSFTAIDFYEKENPLIEKVEFNPADYNIDLILTDVRASHADLSDEYSAIPTEMKGVAKVLGQDVLSRCTMADLLANVEKVREAQGDRAFLRAYHFLNETQRAKEEAIALREKNIERFLQLVNESGRSSWMYLQNICPPGAKKEQQVAIGLALSDCVLQGEGAYRVHGGGFAGTIQAFVPKAKTEEYIRTMESAFGEGCCYILRIRGYGGVKVM
ncbi:MAG: galactokinase [Solobacterium sp.]|nr:galactokinase [Solobacterium sp.]MBQ9824146.1 galactokinase [Solobacterium sp.]